MPHGFSRAAASKKPGPTDITGVEPVRSEARHRLVVVQASRMMSGPKFAKGYLACVALASMGISTAVICSAYAQQSPTESQVKAAYLFNFLRFVAWPEDASTQLNQRWVIGVLGDNLLSDELTQLVSGKVLQGRLLEVKVFLPTDDPRDCHILFIGASQMKRLPSILTSLRGLSVLTVGDMPHFTESGGMIQFVMEEDRVRFMIDVGTAARARLKVSSKLLALARVVNGAERSPSD